MDQAKSGELPNAAVDVYELTEVSEGAIEQKLGTQYDQRDMVRMGKKQELRREFQFFSIWGYAVILGLSWEYALITGVLSLPNGGTAGAVWMFLITCVFMFFVMLSMAEMASMAPTAGGQYHWVSEFAPLKYQKLLSYAVGWLCVLGWQVGMASVSYASAQQIGAIMVLTNPKYAVQGWHLALLSWAITLFAIMCNTLLFRKLPLMEGIVMVLHCFGFFAFLIVLWVMAPRSDSSTVTTFNDNGWSSAGLACLVGISAPVVTTIGADSSCHLSEELKNASWILPRSMLATALTNYILGFIMLVTLVFCVGDIDAAIGSATGQPYVEVLLNATGSKGATLTLTSVMLVLIIACAVNNITTSSRQLWSFARDGGLPFSKWLSYVRPGWDIPMNAMVVTMCFTIVLSVIVIGSSTAFFIFTTLTLTGLLSSYIICIACILTKRLRGEPFPASRFDLGKWGTPINIIALCFLSVAWTFMFFPAVPNPGVAGMNWSVLVYCAVIMLSVIYYIAYGRRSYAGPVVHVRKDV